MSRLKKHSISARGTTLIEATIAMSIALIGLTGLMSVQTLAARSIRDSQRVRQASALANDLQEQVRRWPYTDARLTQVLPVTSLTASDITARWDMGSAALAPSTSRAMYAEQPADPNATVSSGGTYGGTIFTGLNADVDSDGKVDFYRYWTVFEVNFSGSSVPDGKLVQIITRWRDPMFGYRQVATSTFVSNPAAAAQ